MERIFDVLIAVLPSVVVFLTAYYLLKRFMDNESRKQILDLRADKQKNILPLRLQAYERVALYLERIHPHNMVLRLQKPNMSARVLQGELLKTIRSEYDHNVAQQIYVSPQLWEAVKAAREETVKIINIAASKTPSDASALDLSKTILELCSKIEKIPSDFGLEILKKEVRSLF